MKFYKDTIKSTGLIIISSAMIMNLSHALTVKIDGDGATPGTSAVSRQCSIGNSNSFTSTGGNTFFTNETAYSGSVGIKTTVNEGGKGFGGFGGIINFSNCTGEPDFKLVKGDEIWVRSRVKIPSEYIFNSGRSKFYRLRTYYSDESDRKVSDGYIDLYLNSQTDDDPYYPYGFIYEGLQRWSMLGEPDDFFIRDEWKTLEMYVKLDTVSFQEGGEAIVRVWVDGTLVKDITDRATFAREDNFVEDFNLLTYYGNEGSPITQHIYFDDIFITSNPPENHDANGNRYIGMDDPGVIYRPKPPTNTSIQW